jgi:hypothetical protein
MKFSLINVAEQSGSLVSGSWLQNHIGTLASAREAARATETANNNRIEVAIVAEISSTTPALSHYTSLPRLDVDT